jgi:hypothetical protein
MSATVARVAFVALPIVSYLDMVMARPIEPTPVLEGEDAERLLRDLERTCTPEEAKRRVQKARDLLAKVMVPAADDTVAAE